MISNIPEKHLRFILWGLAVCGLIVLSSLFFNSNYAHSLRVALFWVFVLLTVIVTIRLFTEPQKVQKSRTPEALPDPSFSVSHPLSSLKRGLILSYKVWQQLDLAMLLRRFSRTSLARKRSLRTGVSYKQFVSEEPTHFKPIRQRALDDDRTQVGHPRKSALPDEPTAIKLTPQTIQEKRTQPAQTHQAASDEPTTITIKPVSQNKEEPAQFRNTRQVALPPELAAVLKSVRQSVQQEEQTQIKPAHEAALPEGSATTLKPVPRSIREEEPTQFRYIRKDASIEERTQMKRKPNSDRDR